MTDYELLLASSTAGEPPQGTVRVIDVLRSVPVLVVVLLFSVLIPVIPRLELGAGFLTMLYVCGIAPFAFGATVALIVVLCRVGRDERPVPVATAVAVWVIVLNALVVTLCVVDTDFESDFPSVAQRLVSEPVAELLSGLAVCVSPVAVVAAWLVAIITGRRAVAARDRARLSHLAPVVETGGQPGGPSPHPGHPAPRAVGVARVPY